MKFLICSDIHGSTRACDVILDLNTKELFDKIFILGDFCYNGARNDVPSDYFPKKCVEKLNSIKEKIIACKGNCESNVDLMVLDFNIPLFNSYKFGETIFILVHGDDPKFIVDNPSRNVISIFGHTHVPVMKICENGGVLLNPGSMTFPKGNIGKSYIIYDNGNLILYEFDYLKNSYEILNKYKLTNSSMTFEK